MSCSTNTAVLERGGTFRGEGRVARLLPRAQTGSRDRDSEMAGDKTELLFRLHIFTLTPHHSPSFSALLSRARIGYITTNIPRREGHNSRRRQQPRGTHAQPPHTTESQKPLPCLVSPHIPSEKFAHTNGSKLLSIPMALTLMCLMKYRPKR